MRKVKEQELPCIIPNEEGGIWTVDGSIVWCTVKQGKRTARMGGDASHIADIRLEPYEPVYGRIKRIESKSPMDWDNIEAFRVNANLWRMDIFTDNINDEDELIEE